MVEREIDSTEEGRDVRKVNQGASRVSGVRGRRANDRTFLALLCARSSERRLVPKTSTWKSDWLGMSFSEKASTGAWASTCVGS